MTIATVERKPTDWLWPQFDPDACVINEWDGWWGQVTGIGPGTKRGNVIAHAASELGCAFTDVSCTVAWIAPRTRQDEWEDRGMDEAEDEWFHNHEPKLHYRDGDYAYVDDGGNVYIAAVPGWAPADWDAGEPEAVWYYAKKDAPDAVKVYVCKESER